MEIYVYKPGENYVFIDSVGMALGSRKLSNLDLLELLRVLVDGKIINNWPPLNELIEKIEANGIYSRHWVGPGEDCYTLGATASKMAINNIQLDSKDIKMISAVSESYPLVFAHPGDVLQKAIGATPGIIAKHEKGACAGSTFAIDTALRYMLFPSSTINYLLFSSAETPSIYFNQDLSKGSIDINVTLLGDAAFSCILRRGYLKGDKKSLRLKIIGNIIHSDGRKGRADGLDDLGNKNPLLQYPEWGSIYDQQHGHFFMNGPDVFKEAINLMFQTSNEVMTALNITKKDVAFFAPHQANIRILDRLMKKLDIGKEQMWINIQKYGNTSSASTGICLYEMLAAGVLKDGDIVIAPTIGAGLNYGVTAYQYCYC